MKFETDAEADGDALAEFSGRACYLSFNQDRRRPCPEGEQNSTYLAHIREVGHGSVTEHAYWTFLIDDFSKNCTQELVRHRVGVAFSIQSSRYVDQFSDEYFGDSGHSLGVYIPPEIQTDEALFAEWLEVWKSVVVTYNRTFLKLRSGGHDKKTARSIARHIIPGSMCNAVVFTVNARELNHIFAMRGSLPADPEIRRMTMRLWDHVKGDNLFAGWEEVQDEKYGRYLKPKGDTDGILAKLLDRDPSGFNEALRKLGFGPRPRSRPSLDSLLEGVTEENQHQEAL